MDDLIKQFERYTSSRVLALAPHSEVVLLAEVTAMLRATAKLATDPNAVHANLLRGSIARPTVHQMIHIYRPPKVRQALENYAREELANPTVAGDAA